MSIPQKPRSSPLLYAALFFLIIALYLYPLAYNSTIFSPVIGDDKSFLVGSYHLSRIENFTPEQKWDYAYFHIHKPLIIALMMPVHLANLAPFWYLLPFAFCILGGVFLFLFLQDKITNSVILFGAPLMLSLNSVWMYFGLHLLPDIPLAASLMAMLYFLDRAIKPDGKFSKNDWYATMACGIIASLFRIETLPVLLVPLLYYHYVKRGSHFCLDCFRSSLADKNIRNYALISAIALALFFLLYIFAIEKTTNFIDYPGILLGQLSKVQAVTNAIGANQGNLLYIIVETALSFTLLPFLFAVCGIWLAVMKREKALYPCLALLIGLFAESTFITFLSHGEQRYVTRLFPMLTIFACYFADYLCSNFFKPKSRSIAASLLIVGLLVYSSHFLIYRGIGYDNKLVGYRSKMLTTDATAEFAFEAEKILDSSHGTYTMINDAIRANGWAYMRVFTNVDTSSYREYVSIIYHVELLQPQTRSPDEVRGSDAAVLIGPFELPPGAPYETHKFYAEYGLNIYTLTPTQVASSLGTYFNW